MNKEQLTQLLTDAINQHSLKEIIAILIDISTVAETNNPGCGWERVRAA